ncbi:MAG: neutral zinc metallopeptidase [Bacteroidia bacterium]|nr:neutral zinc metallopeptidase [Bacteroidia bacterium]
MKWIGRRQSDNVEDKRSSAGGKAVIGGGVIGLIFLVLKLMSGDGNSAEILNQALQQQMNPSAQTSEPTSPADDSLAAFVSVVLADNEDVWSKVFKDLGLQYQEPKLVLFRNSIESGCGHAGSAIGPFYCPADNKVYIDLAFFQDLKNKLGAPGDFACAYVVAHEVGHHIQNILGTSDAVHSKQQRVSEKEANRLSVAMELQADFYAGIWAHYNEKMKNVLEVGDIDEALEAANAVGDDRLQMRANGQVMPDAFTHGTSKQRMYWFKLGFNSGDINKGNTFKEMGVIY